MEYQVLARKYRPGSFSDMIGQEHITQTLQNSLMREKTAHAYLFVGPRGIGKTTIARIFAKALNCNQAPVKDPCNECDSCRSITHGNNIDIIEIDGASNNSVNDIRNLREEVLYTPVNSRYKIYIIDEVHMLTNQAWNALLKTLEEPPEHIKFLFATTEAHKILPTVLSRCQRFDLRRIPQNLIIERLYKIASNENVKISRQAIIAIAKAANGGMRDALSLLDQIIAFHSSDESCEIQESQVLATFGLTAPEHTDNIILSIINNDYTSLVQNLHAVAQQGKNLEQLFNDILEYLRGIEITLLISNPDLILEVGQDTIEKYKTISRQTNLTKIQRLMESLLPAGKALHDSLNKQIFLETSLFKAMQFANSTKIEDIIARFNELKKKQTINDSSQPKHNSNTINKKIEKADTPPPINNSIQISSPQQQTEQQTKPQPHIQVNRTEPQPRQQQSSVIPSPPEAQQIKKQNVIKESRPDNITVTDKPSFTPDNLWHRLIVEMDSQHINRPQLKFWLQEAKPESIDNNILTISYDEEFNSVHAERVNQEKALLENCLHRITGNSNFKLKIKTIKGLASPSKDQNKIRDIDEVKTNIMNNDFIKKTVEIFNGRIVDFRG